MKFSTQNIILVFLIFLPFWLQSQEIRDHNIIDRFDMSFEIFGGFTFDGENLWIISKNPYEFKKVSSIDGTILKNIPINYNIYSGGVAYNDNHLWVVEKKGSNESARLLKLDAETGNLVRSHPFNLDINNRDNSHGLYFKEDELYLMVFRDGREDEIFVFKEGELIKKKSINFKIGHGITYAENAFWLSTNERDNSGRLEAYLIKCDDDFNVLDEIKFPQNSGYPLGIVWEKESIFWVTDVRTEAFFKLDLSKFTLSINEISTLDSSKILIHPNPTSDILKVTLSDNIKINKVVIYDINGKKIKNISELSNNTIDFSKISKGNYFLRIETDKEISYKKIIKN